MKQSDGKSAGRNCEQALGGRAPVGGNGAHARGSAEHSKTRFIKFDNADLAIRLVLQMGLALTSGLFISYGQWEVAWKLLVLLLLLHIFNALLAIRDALVKDR